MADHRDELQIEFLYRALAEAQDTLKFTDTKAAAVIMLVGGLLAFIGAIHTYVDSPILKVFAALGLANLLVAAVCAMWALSPQVNPAKFVDLGDVQPQSLYYLQRTPVTTTAQKWLPLREHRKMELSVGQYWSALRELDVETIQHILAFELLKVSFIREEKRMQVSVAVRFILVAGAFLSALVVGLYL